MVYPFIYKIVFCSEYTDYKFRETQGVLFASDYATAAGMIDESYGSELCSIKLEPLEESTMLDLPSYVVEKLLTNSMEDYSHEVKP